MESAAIPSPMQSEETSSGELELLATRITEKVTEQVTKNVTSIILSLMSGITSTINHNNNETTSMFNKLEDRISNISNMTAEIIDNLSSLSSTNSSQSLGKSSRTSASLSPEMCRSNTKKGEYCKLKAKEGSKYCSIHTENTSQKSLSTDNISPNAESKKGSILHRVRTKAVSSSTCKGVKQDGLMCNRKVKNALGYCPLHRGQYYTLRNPYHLQSSTLATNTPSEKAERSFPLYQTLHHVRANCPAQGPAESSPAQGFCLTATSGSTNGNPSLRDSLHPDKGTASAKLTLPKGGIKSSELTPDNHPQNSKLSLEDLYNSKFINKKDKIHFDPDAIQLAESKIIMIKAWLADWKEVRFEDCEDNLEIEDLHDEYEVYVNNKLRLNSAKLIDYVDDMKKLRSNSFT